MSRKKLSEDYTFIDEKPPQVSRISVSLMIRKEYQRHSSRPEKQDVTKHLF